MSTRKRPGAWIPAFAGMTWGGVNMDTPRGGTPWVPPARRLISKATRVLVSLLLVAMAVAGYVWTALADPANDIVITMADGSPEARLVFDGAGSKTVYLKVPAGWEASMLSINMEGQPYVSEAVDQRNEAARYEGTYSVRAQRFKPSRKPLSGVELFLARTSQRSNEFTVEIREDDGKGYPSGTVLASATKSVAAGTYRWERFHFPTIEVEPGRPYWILGYAVSPETVVYPAQPSLGDYGYYIGLSSRDEYAGGDSLDPVTSPAGLRWERFSSRSTWDLMFRTVSSEELFAANPAVSLGDETEAAWRYDGEFRGVQAAIDLTSRVTRYLLLKGSTAGTSDTQIPIVVSSGSAGAVRVFNVRIVRRPVAEESLMPAGQQLADSATPQPAGNPTGAGATSTPVADTASPTAQTSVLATATVAASATAGLPAIPTLPPAAAGTPGEEYVPIAGRLASPVPLPTPTSSPAQPYSAIIDMLTSGVAVPTPAFPTSAPATTPTATPAFPTPTERAPSPTAQPTAARVLDLPPTPGPQPVSAPTQQPEQVATAVAQRRPAPKPLGPPGPRFVPPTDVSLKGIGFTNMSLRGVDVTKDLFFPGPGGFPLADGNYLRLFFSHSGILLADRSTMIVKVNSIPVATVRLNGDNANLTELKVSLPKDRLVDTVNHVRLEFYMRIMDGPCTDELNNPALNATIYQESFIHYEYASLVRRAPTPSPTLADYPVPFVYPSYAWPDEPFFVLPDDPTPAELTAAASIAAKMAQIAGGKVITPTVATASQLDRERKEGYNLVFVGKAQSLGLPQELRLKASVEITQTALEGDMLVLAGEKLGRDSGVIRLVNSPWNPANWVLFVGGATDQAVWRAGSALSSRTYLATLKGDQAVITQDPRPGLLLAEDNPRLPKEVTLRQIGLSDISVSGLGELDTSGASFSSPAPNPAEDAYVDLLLSHSPLLIASESSLRVELNGLPIRSIQLDDSNVQPSRIRVDLPYSALRPGPNGLTFRLTMYGQVGDFCGPVDRTRSWAVVHADSLVHLPPAGPEPPLSLGLFPYPFLGTGPRLESAYLERNVLVLPDDPGEWRDFLHLAMALGRYLTADTVSLPTITSRDVSGRGREERNVILYGSWGAVGLPDGESASLPLQIVAGRGKTFRVPAEETVSVSDAVPMAIVQTIPSPWNKAKALLLVSGTRGETLTWGTSALGRGRLRGNLSTVTLENEVSTFYEEHLRWPWY